LFLMAFLLRSDSNTNVQPGTTRVTLGKIVVTAIIAGCGRSVLALMKRRTRRSRQYTAFRLETRLMNRSGSIIVRVQKITCV
jgi:hypothetical protein